MINNPPTGTTKPGQPVNLTTKRINRLIGDARIQSKLGGFVDGKRVSGLEFFYHNVWPHSFKDGDFKGGWHPESLVKLLAQHLRFVMLFGRGHGKSLFNYLINAWLCFITEKTGDPSLYISSTSTTSTLHTREFIKHIDRNPFFGLMTDKKSATTESLFVRQWDDAAVFEMRSLSILQSLRGYRTGLMYFDDVYTGETPDVIQTDVAVRKINNKVLGTAWSILKTNPNARVGFSGTALSESDLFGHQPFLDAIVGRDGKGIIIKRPAINPDGTPVWPELFSQAKHDELRNTLGPQMYDREYNLMPPTVTDSRIDPQALRACIDPELPNLKQYEPEHQEMNFFTWDPSTEGGHASQMAVWKIDTAGLITQVASIWIDRQDITAQIAICNRVWIAFKISRGWADNGGGVLTHANNTGELPNGLELIKPTLQLKGDMMGALDIRVNNKSIRFIPDERQYRSILMMSNDLKTRQVGNDHGESAFTAGFACLYMMAPSKPVVVMGSQF